MIRIFPCFCFFLFVFSDVSGQNVSIVVNDLRPACLRSLHRIPVTLTESFQPGNQFWVQVKTSAASETYSQLAATLRNGAIEVTFLDSSLTSYPQLLLRVVATAPAVASNWQDYFHVHGKGRVSITSLVSDTLNRFDEHRFQIKSHSSSDGFVILNDSSRIRINGNPVTSIAEHPEVKMVDQTTNFTIARGENFCGPMQTAGQARAVVNEVSMISLSVWPSTVCPGSTISVHFSAGGALPATAVGWKVRLKEALYTGDDKPGGRTMELAARRTSDNTLEAVLPSGFVPEFNTSFNIRVLTPESKIVGGIGKVLLQVQLAPQVAFEKTAYTVAFGEAALLKLQATAAGPYRVRLSDGRDYFPGASTTLDDSNPLYKKPAQTTTYVVQSVSSACGMSTPSQSPAATVTVLPGMVLDDLDPAKPFCEQQMARLHFISSVPISASSILTMEIRHIKGETKTVPVTRDGDYVVFKIPVFSDYHTEYSRLRATFTFRLVSSAPAIRSLEVGNVSIQSKPQLIYPYTQNQFEFDTPTNTRIYMEMEGGGPYDVVTSSGLHLPPRPAEALFFEALFVRQTQEFGIKSVSNACFTTTDLPRAKLTVRNPGSIKPFVSVLPVAFSGCHRDSLELDVQASGTFGESNVFRIQITRGDNCCNYETIATVTHSGKIKLKIPGDDTRGTSTSGMQNFSLRVVSTQPEVVGSEFFPSLSYPLFDMGIDFVDRATYQPIFTLNGDHYMNFNFRGASIDTLVYSDGRQDYKLTGQGIMMTPIKIHPQAGENKFTIKSVTTSCGRQQVNINKSMQVVPYRIVMTEAFTNLTVCPAANLNVPFVIQDGDASQAIYAWEVRKEGETSFQTIFTGTNNNRVSGIIPATLGPGVYVSRISTQHGPVSNEVRVMIGQLPSASLTFPSHPNENPVTLDYGERLDVRVDYTGTFPIATVNQYNEKKNKYTTPEEYYTYPSDGVTYQLKFVSNACGFAPPSQAIRLNVKPALDMSMLVKGTVCAGGKSLEVTYKLKGDFDLSDSFIRIELSDRATKKIYLLDSTKVPAVTRAFDIPKDLRAGSYDIIVRVPKYDLRQQLSMYINTVVDATLFGDMTINPGDNAGLSIRVNNLEYYEPIDYVLSDGTKGALSSADEYIPVSPSKTTTYRIVSVSSQCGAGTFSGSSVVTVQAPGDRTINVTNWRSTRTDAFCATDTISVGYAIKGSFSGTNRFTVQVSDINGQNFRDIPTSGISSPLTAILPAELPRGFGYRIRVISSDVGTSSATYVQPLFLRYRAKARFGTTSILVNDKPVVSLPLQFEGDSPWYYEVRGTLIFPSRESYRAVDTMFVPNTGPAVFTLLGVRNVCGIGIVELPATILYEQVLGVEDPLTSFDVKISPNPFTRLIRLMFESAAQRNVSIHDMSGIPLLQTSVKTEALEIQTELWPPGMYILTVEEQQQLRSFRIFKP
jgi:hypothetical protein